MSVSKLCLFYDSRIQKKVPCLIKEDSVYEVKDDFGIQYYIHVEFDSSRYSTFNTFREELLRFSSEFVKLNDIYPAETQSEIDYADSVLPKILGRVTTPHLTTSSHNSDELDRFEKIVDALTDVVGTVSATTYVRLLNFILYEVYFLYTNSTERSFIDSLSASQLVSQPGTVYVPQIIRMLKKLFSKIDSSFYTGAYSGWKILNFKNMNEFESDVPKILNLTNLQYNVNYITGI